MSRFMSSNYAGLVPYVPGEQPRDLTDRVKLNTNENPFPPSEKAKRYAAKAAENLQLYSDTECTLLRAKIAELYAIDPDEIMCTNGSDEALDLCFLAFCDEQHPAIFPDITYGFYKVFAEVDRVPYQEIPLKADMTVDLNDYLSAPGKTVFIANPNAPTGIALPKADIIRLLESDPDRIVVVDEAYVDFGGESCVDLIHTYDNLVVTQTCSKSRSLAGARLGFAFASRPLIRDLNTLRNSRNPYNVNTMTMMAGLGAFEDEEYTRDNCRQIRDTRAYLTAALRGMGFTVLDSSANFVFAASDRISGKDLYLQLKARNIFIRHFDTPRLAPYNRITVGTVEQVDRLLCAINQILEATK